MVNDTFDLPTSEAHVSTPTMGNSLTFYDTRKNNYRPDKIVPGINFAITLPDRKIENFRFPKIQNFEFRKFSNFEILKFWIFGFSILVFC